MISVVFFEPSDLREFPLGGQLTFAKHFVETYPGQVSVCCLTRSPKFVGRNSILRIGDRDIPCFFYGKVPSNPKKPWLPYRILYLVSASCRLSRIRSMAGDVVCIQSHELLLLAPFLKNKKIIFIFPGLAGPIGISKYRTLRTIFRFFDKIFFWLADKYADVLFAAADESSITEFKNDNGFKSQIHSLPTRVDRSSFYPLPGRMRTIDCNRHIRLITTGRIHQAKGWDFLLEVVVFLQGDGRDVSLTFVGDGDDRSALLGRARELGIDACVHVTGHLPPSAVASCLRESDVFVMASITEGWSTSLLEAVATSLPCVVTDFSSAREMVQAQKNGFVIGERSVAQFARAILRCEDLEFSVLQEWSEVISKRYDAAQLGTDFIRSLVIE